MFDRCTWMYTWREWIQARKYSSKYFPGKFPPSKAGQYSTPGNIENTTKIFHKKSNPKAHNRQIQQGWNEEENAKGSQRERSGYPQREAHQTHSRSLGRNPTSPKRVGPIFNILKEQNFQPRILYPAKLSFTIEGKIKSFMNKQVLRNFITTRPALQELLKEALYIERTTSMRLSKNIPKSKEHQHKEEFTSTNG